MQYASSEACQTESGSDLGLAYGNRSAVLFRLHKYEVLFWFILVLFSFYLCLLGWFDFVMKGWVSIAVVWVRFDIAGHSALLLHLMP